MGFHFIRPLSGILCKHRLCDETNRSDRTEAPILVKVQYFNATLQSALIFDEYSLKLYSIA